MPVGPYVVDFMCRAARLVVELDGYSHDSLVERDASRERFITARGFYIVRFSNAEVVANLEGVLATIEQALTAAPPPAPPASGRGVT